MSIKFFFFNFGGHQYFLWDHWCPCFGLLVTSPLGFKAKGDSFACKLYCLCTMDSSDVTSTDLLVASMAAELFHPRTCIQTLVGLESRIEHLLPIKKLTFVTCCQSCYVPFILPACNLLPKSTFWKRVLFLFFTTVLGTSLEYWMFIAIWVWQLETPVDFFRWYIVVFLAINCDVKDSRIQTCKLF